MTKAPVRKLRLGEVHARMDMRDNGSILVRNTHPLGAYPARITDQLDHWAAVAPERIWLAERDPRPRGGGRRARTAGPAAEAAGGRGRGDDG